MTFEVREYGQDRPMVVVGLRQADLGENAVHVLLDGPLGDPQPAGNAATDVVVIIVWKARSSEQEGHRYGRRGAGGSPPADSWDLDRNPTAGLSAIRSA
jgi:hypothetical protein